MINFSSVADNLLYHAWKLTAPAVRQRRMVAGEALDPYDPLLDETYYKQLYDFTIANPLRINIQGFRQAGIDVTFENVSQFHANVCPWRVPHDAYMDDKNEVTLTALFNAVG